MSEGIFDLSGAVDFDEVEEVKFETIPSGIYGATVAAIEDRVSTTGKSAGKHQLVIDYVITDANDEKWIGKTVKEFKTYTLPGEPDFDATGLGYIKARFIDLGMPKDFKGAPDKESFLGLDVVLTLRQNGDYTNVRKVELVPDGGTAEADSDSSDEENPFGV